MNLVLCNVIEWLTTNRLQRMLVFVFVYTLFGQLISSIYQQRIPNAVTVLSHQIDGAIFTQSHPFFAILTAYEYLVCYLLLCWCT